MAAGDWEAVNRRILEQTDIRAAYEALGVQFAAGAPNAKGWLACKAVDREDRNPSAAVCVSGDALGRYRDLGGDQLNLSLWDFAARFGNFLDWKAARNHFARKAGVKVGKAGRGKQPDDLLGFQDWNDSLCSAWCRHKPGVTAESVKANGGRLAKTPKDGKKPDPVVVIPIYGPKLADADPVGWVAFHRGGRPLPVWHGKGEPPTFVKMKTIKHSQRGWLGLHGLLHLEQAEVVWKVEGVPDLLALWAAIPAELRGRHVVLTNSGGAGEIPAADLIEHLNGKRVYVVHDADQPGQGIAQDEQDRHRVFGARLWCQELAKFAAEVRNVQLPYEVADSHGHDVRDFLNDGHSYQDLLDLADQTAPYQDASQGDPPASGDSGGSDGDDSGGGSGDGEPGSADAGGDDQETAVERKILEALQLYVYGEVSNGVIKVFSLKHRKSDTIKDISRWSYEKILQFCGPVARTAINKSDEYIPGKYTVQQVRDAVSLIAGYNPLGKDDHEVGRGCWRGQTIEGDENQTVVLVSSKDGARLNGSAELRQVFYPCVDGLQMDLGSDESPWYDFGRLKSYVERAHSDPKWVESVVYEADELFRRWSWRSDVAPTIVTGLVLATWVQTLWKWRPLVSVTGGSNTGKSSLFSALGGDTEDGGLFGSLAVLSSQSSEAGIRQAVNNTGKVVLCDEFEESREREKTLNLFRTSGRGSRVLRGTTGQRGQAYGLKHIPWVAAIEVGLKREPDRNRFIKLELVPPAEWGKLEIPDEETLAELGQRLLAIALYSVRAAVPLAVSLKRTKVDGVDKRVIESYAVPAAILAVAMRAELSAGEFLVDLLRNVEREEQGRSDDTDLLEDILSSHVDCGRGVKYSVAQLLSSSVLLHEHQEATESHGVGIVTAKRGRYSRDDDESDRYLFLNPPVIRRMLLRGTDWERQEIGQILKRIEAAEQSRHRLAGRLARGVRIPFDWIEAHHLDGEQADGIVPAIPSTF